MPIIIGLLILIVLLLLFGPWLLVAIGVVLAAIVAGIVWLVKTILVPAAIILAALVALAVVGYVLLAIWVGADKLAASDWYAKLTSPREKPSRPLPPLVRSKAKSSHRNP